MVKSIAFAVEQEVKAVETLVMVEAMKMENVLRREQRHHRQDGDEGRRFDGGRRCHHGVCLMRTSDIRPYRPILDADSRRHLRIYIGELNGC
ncbi:MAG: hypothetical protein J0H18_17045 [Rhizobiales bacterium]|nr:hypothetical protein [Hyphomicrobiales bacterium]